MRKKFYKYLSDLFKTDPRIAILLGDIGVFSFKDSFGFDPSRIYNLGIMEQSMIGVSCGLSKSGFIPFVHSIAPFITERCYEQLKLNLGYENVNSFIVSVGNSYDYASLGCTHHCPNDLRIVSSIPNFKTFCPGNSKDVENIINENLNVASPKYIRLSETENNLSSFKPEYKDLDLLNLNTNGICIIVGNAIKDFGYLINSNPNYSIIYTYNISNFEINKLKKIMLENSILPKITVVEPCYDSGISSLISNSMDDIRFIKNISLPKIFIEKYGSKKDIDNYLEMDDISIIKKLKNIYDSPN